MELRLDKLGRKVLEDRRADQTASAYASTLARAWSDDRLGRVGELIDRSLYGPVEPSEDERALARRTLDELADRPAPDPIGTDT